MSDKLPVAGFDELLVASFDNLCLLNEDLDDVDESELVAGKLLAIGRSIELIMKAPLKAVIAHTKTEEIRTCRQGTGFLSTRKSKPF